MKKIASHSNGIDLKIEALTPPGSVHTEYLTISIPTYEISVCKEFLENGPTIIIAKLSFFDELVGISLTDSWQAIEELRKSLNSYLGRQAKAKLLIPYLQSKGFSITTFAMLVDLENLPTYCCWELIEEASV